ncbi:MAG: hypothetical protein HY226_04100, partial [Candidatus Vogelbacteria bacterium]|nr:hypothetical protein [Candidatus Vogelbacteria bacterium]
MKLNNFLSVLLVVVILFSFAYLDNVFATTINYGLLGSNYSGQSAVRRSIPSLGAAGSLQATIKNGAVAAPFFVATNKQIINGSDTTLYPDAPDAVSSFPYASTTVLWADKSITTKEITAASSSLGYASTTALTISSGNLYLDNSGKSAIINIANSMVLDTKYGGLGMSIDPSSNSLDQIKNILFYVNGNGALTTLNMGDGIGKVLESNGDSLSWKTDEVGRGTATALDQVVTPDSSINSIPYIVSDPNTGHSKLTTSANFV